MTAGLTILPEVVNEMRSSFFVLNKYIIKAFVCGEFSNSLPILQIIFQNLIETLASKPRGY
jgi:hypothetical protein